MKTIKLTQKQKELIERMGVHSEKAGASPAQSRIMALLLVSDETELTFEEIYETLQISKSAASNAINALLATERIEYITKTGDRKRYFRSRIGQWGDDFDKRFNKMLEISQLMKEILEQRTKATKEFNGHLQKFINFMEFLQSELPELHKKWKKLNK
jgi:DNA-binding transcriptional regulator GbsR (MarR family)